MGQNCCRHAQHLTEFMNEPIASRSHFSISFDVKSERPLRDGCGLAETTQMGSAGRPEVSSRVEYGTTRPGVILFSWMTSPNQPERRTSTVQTRPPLTSQAGEILQPGDPRVSGLPPPRDSTFW